MSLPFRKTAKYQTQCNYVLHAARPQALGTATLSSTTPGSANGNLAFHAQMPLEVARQWRFPAPSSELRAELEGRHTQGAHHTSLHFSALRHAILGQLAFGLPTHAPCHAVSALPCAVSTARWLCSWLGAGCSHRHLAVFGRSHSFTRTTMSTAATTATVRARAIVTRVSSILGYLRRHLAVCCPL